MARRTPQDLAVGALFALALIVLAVGIMAVGTESRLFVPKAGYRIRFPTTDGLRVGSPVKMAGVQVGSVTKILLPTDPEATGIEVHVGVEQRYAQRVREDSRAALVILQFLSGEKFVEILPGSPDSPALPEDALIPTEKEFELIERGEAIAENLTEITRALRNILGPLQEGEGLIGKMLTDPDFGTRGAEALSGALENVERLTEDLSEGRGMMGRLLYDRELADRLDAFAASAESFSEVMRSIERGEGAVGSLFVEGGSAEQAIEDLREAAAGLKRLTRRLESGEGLLGRLLYDSDYSDALATDLGRIARNVSEITDKINRGKGTVGALVNERELYEGAEEVVAGVNDSKFARWLLRRYRKKGIEAEELSEETASEAADAEP